MATVFWRIYRIFLLLTLVVSLLILVSFDQLNHWRYQHHVEKWVMPAMPYIASQMHELDERRSIAWLELISALTGADWEIYDQAKIRFDWQRQQARLVHTLNDGRHLVAVIDDWPKFYTGVGLLLANKIAQDPKRLGRMVTKFNQEFMFSIQYQPDKTISLPFLAQQQWMQGQPVVQNSSLSEHYFIYIPIAGEQTLVLGPFQKFKWITPSALIMMILVIALLTALLVAAVWLPFRRRLAQTVRFVDQVALASSPLPLKQYPKDELGQMEYKIACMAERIRAAIFENKQMVKAVSHDLKTPLSRMRFALEAMPDSLHGSLEWKSIRRNIQLLGEYIDDIILFDGLQSDEKPIEKFEPINVVEEIEYAIHQSMRNDIQWLIKLPKDQSQFPIAHTHWVRLVGNLLDNAQRYAMTKISVTLEINDQGLYFQVDNDGPEIDEQDRKHIFMPFYRSDTARNLTTASYGLGLSVCRSLAGYYQGKLQLEKSELSGTCFSLFIPCHSQQEKP